MTCSKAFESSFTEICHDFSEIFQKIIDSSTANNVIIGLNLHTGSQRISNSSNDPNTFNTWNKYLLEQDAELDAMNLPEFYRNNIN